MSVSEEHKSLDFNQYVQNLTNEQLDLVVHYFEFLCGVIEDNQPKVALNMLRALVYYLAECKANYPNKSQALTRAEQICGQYLTLVELHYHEEHRVDWYASQMCLSPKYLSNVLKQTLNLSPNKCIDEALVRQAKSLLSSTSLSVQEISDRLGFQNQSHFGTFFRRQTGCSPSDFRRTGK